MPTSISKKNRYINIGENGIFGPKRMSLPLTALRPQLITDVVKILNSKLKNEVECAIRLTRTEILQQVRGPEASQLKLWG